jgi:hypothetical protein
MVMPDSIVFLSRIELTAAASSPGEAVRKQEFDMHVNSDFRHLPPGGLTGQVLVVTTAGPAWKWPKVVCGCGPGTITFQETSQTAALQGIDFNAIREVEIV